MHVAARTLATHALSIFGDHSDVMACRQHRLRPALLRHRAGGAGPRRDRPRGHAARPDARSSTSSTASAPRTRSRSIELLDDDDLRALLDEERDRGPPRARAHARPPGARAARRRTPTPSSRPARRRTASTTPARQSSQEAMDALRDADRPRLPALRLRRPPRGRARHRADGLRRRDGATRRSTGSVARGEKVGVAQGAALPPVRARARSSRRCPRRCAPSRCSTAPRSRARSASRSTSTSSPRSPRRAEAALAFGDRCRGSSAAATASPRRSSRRRW